MNEALWMGMLAFNFLAILLIYRFYGKLGLYIWIPISIIIANIQVLKTVEILTFQAATLGNIVYGASFLVTDILSENYGKKSAQKAVQIGFISLFAMTILMNFAIFFIPGPEDFVQDSLKTIFSFMPQIAIASLSAYCFSQFHDIWSYHFWKNKVSDDKFIFLRNNLSTIVSQFIDTLVFTTIAFIDVKALLGGSFKWVFSNDIMLDIFISTYVLKVLVAIFDTPFIYLASYWHKKKIIDDGI